MEKLRIKEALEVMNEGKESKDHIRLIDLAREIWGDSSTQTQRMNISNLAGGKTKTIRVSLVPRLCRLLKCDANFLFGIKNGKKDD